MTTAASRPKIVDPPKPSLSTASLSISFSYWCRFVTFMKKSRRNFVQNYYSVTCRNDHNEKPKSILMTIHICRKSMAIPKGQTFSLKFCFICFFLFCFYLNVKSVKSHTHWILSVHVHRRQHTILLCMFIITDFG